VLAVQRRVGLSVCESMKPVADFAKAQRQRFDGYEKARVERKSRLQSPEARYTVILHYPRKQLGITVSEYCLADAVHKLSSSRSNVPGWCFASKEHLGESLGFTRRGIQKMIQSLKGKGILEA
jgi:hypothetical protein